MVICLERGGDLYMAQLNELIPLVLLSLASVKSRLVLPFWYWLTRVVPRGLQRGGGYGDSAGPAENPRGRLRSIRGIRGLGD